MRILAVACILALALAGCGGKSDDSTSSDPIVTSGSISSRVSGDATNNPPTGSLRPSTVAGAAPLAVNFTMDGTDKDKDKLTWTLDVTGDGKSDKTGTTLPATFLHTYHSPGVYNVTYKLTDAKVDVTFSVLITVTAPTTGGTPMLEDGAEGDVSKWAFHNEVVVDAIADQVPSGADHPLGGWFQDTAQFRTGAKSWHSPYPDNYEATMTLAAPIEVPVGGATLSFWLKGGAENNNNDGIYVNAGPDADNLENQVYQAVVLPEWKQFFFDVGEGPLVIQFLFNADASCSSDPEPTGGPVACGEGWDAGGFWVDDIVLS